MFWLHASSFRCGRFAASILHFYLFAADQAGDRLDQVSVVDQTGNGQEQSSDKTSAECTTRAASGTVSLS